MRRRAVPKVPSLGPTTEAAEQSALAAWLDALGVLWFHPPNEGRRNIITGARLRRQGMKRGVPDVLIFDPPPAHPRLCGVAIELKLPKGHRSQVSAEQTAWLESLRERGWLACVAYGADDAIETLKGLGYGHQ